MRILDRHNKHRCYDENCVCEVVEKIVEAQNKVAQEATNCDISCHQSIRDLLSPTRENENTTIPFILYCKEGCKPFIASGVHKQPIEGFPHDKYYACVETPVLRAKQFTKKGRCCVKVELLRPVNANGRPVADKGKDLCDFFHEKTPYKTIQFRETGICLTLDLKDFVGISCLDATRPLPK